MAEGTQSSGKLTAAMVLGIIGGVMGILGAMFAMLVGGVATALEADGGETVAGLGFVAFFLAVLGIVGGAMSKSKPRAAAVCQGIACIGGFIAVSAGWILAGPLLLVGAVLAWVGRPKNVVTEPATGV